MEKHIVPKVHHMNTPKIFESDYRFCKILWKNEPIKSGQLVQMCAEELGWKPSTTYTVIKRLTERGVVVTEKMIVRALVKEDEAQVSEINDLLDNKFNGSCPAFLAAFSKSGKMTEKDIDEIQKMIDAIRAQNE